MKNEVNRSILYLQFFTENIVNLNDVNMYLARSNDIKALKALKLIILAKENNLIQNNFDITNNAIRSTKDIHDNLVYFNESVVGNLFNNQLLYASQVNEYLIKKYMVDLNMKNRFGKTIFDDWLSTFNDIENDLANSFKRYDLTEAKLNILKSIIINHKLSKNNEENIINTLKSCIINKYNYSFNDLQTMRDIINYYYNGMNKELLYYDDEDKENLENINISDDEGWYIIETMPKLLEKDIIKLRKNKK